MFVFLRFRVLNGSGWGGEGIAKGEEKPHNELWVLSDNPCGCGLDSYSLLTSKGSQRRGSRPFHHLGPSLPLHIPQHVRANSAFI